MEAERMNLYKEVGARIKALRLVQYFFDTHIL